MNEWMNELKNKRWSEAAAVTDCENDVGLRVAVLEDVLYTDCLRSTGEYSASFAAHCWMDFDRGDCRGGWRGLVAVCSAAAAGGWDGFAGGVGGRRYGWARQ